MACVEESIFWDETDDECVKSKLTTDEDGYTTLETDVVDKK